MATVTAPPPPELPRFRLTLARESASRPETYPIISRPSAAAALLWRLLQDRDTETLVAIYLDRSHRLIDTQVAHVGTLDRVAADCRRILVGGLLVNAPGVIVGHNHLSGDPTPSHLDETFTHRLACAGSLVGVSLADSLIVADEERWTSLWITARELWH